MDVRKLVKAGKHSHSVSLPKSWLLKHGLKAGDSVYLISGEREITVTPFATASVSKERERTIIVGDRQFDAVRRELTSAYINNYHVIHFTQVKDAKRILDSLKDFAALEVVDQGPNHITVKDLLNLADVNVDQSLRRMDMIIRTLFKDSEQREGDLNKLYFLLYRLLQGALRDEKVANALSLKQENALLTWYLVVNLEDIGDVLKNVKKKDSLSGVEKAYLDATKAFFTRDKELAEKVLGSWQSLVDDCKKKECVEQVRELCTKINNVARIVLDLE